jgi:diaminohydroxyphosphoribosylaminopyrimidine deaminase/5-amino-6-(5-phosphoribosylamino)uracil reductase
VIDHPRDDVSYMREALALAATVPLRPWPNPPVGALVVGEDGRVLSRGAHHGPGTPHAEVVALDLAGGRARGATLYCTLEPCNHTGRTGPCAERIARSGVRRLVVGVRDPNPRVRGGGLERLKQAGVDVTLGVLGEEALELIWPFAATGAFARPFVLLKTATSLDGRFAPEVRAERRAVYLTGPAARREVHRLRRWADLVLVGEGTIVADQPALDGRLAAAAGDACPEAEPMPGYLDTDLSASPPWPGRRHLVFCGRECAPAERVREIERRGGTVVACDEHDGRVALPALVAALPGHGIQALLVEGGPSVARSFLAAGLVDRWVSFVAPIVLGAGAGWPPGGAGYGDGRSYHLTRCDSIGPDARLVHDTVSFDDTLRRLTAPPEA